MPTRRDGLRAAGLALAAALPMPWGARAEAPAAVPAAPPADAAALALEPPLADMWVGEAGAPVTVIEYASLTCSHCAAFHNEVFPVLRSRWIDAGKVRFVLRAYPRDTLDVAAFMLSRCKGNDRYYPVTDALFETQDAWAFTKDPFSALRAAVAKAGVGGEDFDACMKNQTLYDAVKLARKQASDTLKITSTPTLFVNGVRHVGALTPDMLAGAIDGPAPK